MKNKMLGVGLVIPILVAWRMQTKIKEERVDNAPKIVTYVKLAYKPVIHWAARQVLRGRLLDRDTPQRGRFTRSDVYRILEKTWCDYDKMAPAAKVERLMTIGSRQNVLLGVLVYALYQALLAEGIEKEYCTELATDVLWKGYETWIVLPRSIARLMVRDPHKQMGLMLLMFRRYPFNPPGYDWDIHSDSERIATDFYRCPIHDYFQSLGDEEMAFFRNSICTLDFAFAQVMVEGGSYVRPHTLSAGDKVCDMKWIAKAKKHTIL